ncbi:MAG: Maf family protein [bacterium]|nr:Maf family protein [bacterium]
MKLILASSSPRRSEILYKIGLTHEIIQPNVPEERKANETIQEHVVRLSKEKVQFVANNVNEDAFILGADTMVVLEDKWLGKPSNEEEAFQILSLLSGKSHLVYTGFTILYNKYNKIISDYEVTKVFFKTLQPDEICEYILTGEPFDKAGAYGFQGFGARYIYRIEGCFYNVMGLPASKVYEALKTLEW